MHARQDDDDDQLKKKKKKKKSSDKVDSEQSSSTQRSRAAGSKYAMTSQEMFCMHQATAALAGMEGTTFKGPRRG